MNLKDIFNGKKSKSFAEQLAAVKSIFKSSYEQAIQLNSAKQQRTQRLNRMRLLLFKLKQTLTPRFQKIIPSILIN